MFQAVGIHLAGKVDHQGITLLKILTGVKCAGRHSKTQFFFYLPDQGVLRALPLIDISCHQDIPVTSVLADQDDPVSRRIIDDGADGCIKHRKTEFPAVWTIRNHSFILQIFTD